MKPNIKTLAIKARVYNQIRLDLSDKATSKENKRYYDKVLTDEEKAKLFDKWFALNREADKELHNYKAKRKYKAKVEKLRKDKKDLVVSN